MYVLVVSSTSSWALLFVGTSIALGNRIVYSWLGLFGAVLLVPSTLGLYQFIYADNNRIAIHIGVLANYIGIVFLIGIYLSAYLAEIARPFMEASSDPVFDMTSQILDNAAFVTILIGSLLTYGIGPVGMSYASLKAAVVPKWLAWMGLVGGVYGLLWGGWVWLIPPERILIYLPSVVLVLLWSIIMGVYMVRSPQPTAS